MKNLSAEPTNKLFAWLPHDLIAEEIVIFPDACPGKSPLPTGTSVRTSQPDWRRFALSDVGCGMRLLRSTRSEITLPEWNTVADVLKANKGRLGDLGGGNHFLDGLLPYGAICRNCLYGASMIEFKHNQQAPGHLSDGWEPVLIEDNPTNLQVSSTAGERP